MNKRLVKRHKRQVSRAREKIRLSEPDVRTPEEVKAAREASRPAADRRGGGGRFSTPSTQSQTETADTAVQPAPEGRESTASEPGGAADAEGQGAGRPQRPFEPGKQVL